MGPGLFCMTPLRHPLPADENVLAVMLFAGYALMEHNEDHSPVCQAVSQ
jgi:hypothetical protein